MSKQLKKLAVCNNKGGVGKTTTTAAIGHILGTMGYKVLLVDADPQGNMSNRFGYSPMEKQEKTISDAVMAFIKSDEADPAEFISKTKYENVDIIISTLQFSDLKPMLVAASGEWNFIYERMIKKIESSNTYDFIVFDTRTGLEADVMQVMIAVDWLLVPMQAANDSLEGMAAVSQFQTVCKRGNPNLKIVGGFFNMVEAQTSDAKDLVPIAKEAYPSLMLDTIVPKDVKAIKSQNDPMPITAFDYKGRAATKFVDLTKEVLEKIG